MEPVIKAIALAVAIAILAAGLRALCIRRAARKAERHDVQTWSDFVAKHTKGGRR